MFFLSDKKSNLKKLFSDSKFLLGIVILAGLVIELSGCGGGRTIWKNYGDSCISISDNPPLQRVINYTDHDLCERELSPRKAPNPKTRSNNMKE